jgi:hypothetical protein
MPIIARVASSASAAALLHELAAGAIPQLLGVDQHAVEVEHDGCDAHAAVSSASRDASDA